MWRMSRDWKERAARFRKALDEQNKKHPLPEGQVWLFINKAWQIGTKVECPPEFRVDAQR